MNSRFFLLVFLVYLVIEGALRKWGFPNLSTELFALKYVIILSGFAFYCLIEKIHGKLLTGFEFGLIAAWIFLTLGLTAADAFSTRSLMASVYYLAMLPLIVLLPYNIRSMDDLNNLGEKYLYLAICVCILGLIQYASPPDSIINKYVGGSADQDGMFIALMGGTNILVRITGSFSYITPYSNYLGVMLIIAWVILILQQKTIKKWFLWFALGLIIVNISMTGSRAIFVMSVMFSGLFLFQLLATEQMKYKIFAIIMFVISIGGIASFQSETFEALSARNEMAGDDDRVSGALLMPFFTIEKSTLTGEGLGSTFMGLEGHQALVGFDETAEDRLGIEGGYIYYLLALVFKIYFFFLTIILFNVTQDRDVKIWALAAFAIQLSSIWTIPVYQSVMNAFYFSSIGLVIWLRNWENLSNKEQNGV